jgi:hypothetical protein
MLHVELDQSGSFEDYCAATFTLNIRRSLLRPESVKYNHNIIGATDNGQMEEEREKSA